MDSWVYNLQKAGSTEMNTVTIVLLLAAGAALGITIAVGIIAYKFGDLIKAIWFVD